MTTAAQVIASARITLNDAVPTLGSPRYSDATLLGYVNDGVTEAYALRPDLLFGSYSTTPAALNLGDPMPFEGRERLAVEAYIVARAEFIEDQHVNSGRAQAAIALSKAMMAGG
jgi:hypothetical protein